MPGEKKENSKTQPHTRKRLWPRLLTALPQYLPPPPPPSAGKGLCDWRQYNYKAPGPRPPPAAAPADFGPRLHFSRPSPLRGSKRGRKTGCSSPGRAPHRPAAPWEKRGEVPGGRQHPDRSPHSPPQSWGCWGRIPGWLGPQRAPSHPPAGAERGRNGASGRAHTLVYLPRAGWLTCNHTSPAINPAGLASRLPRISALPAGRRKRTGKLKSKVTVLQTAPRKEGKLPCSLACKRVKAGFPPHPAPLSLFSHH